LLAPFVAFAQSNPEILSPGTVLAPDAGPLELRLVATNASTAFNNLFAAWRIQLPNRTLTASSASTQTESGETRVTLSFGNVTTADSGSVVVSYVPPGGAMLSSPAFLLRVVAGAPEIGTPPATQSLAAGRPLQLYVLAGGSAPLTYQWQKDGVPISGATRSSYLRANLQAADAGAYAVVVANAQGSVTSGSAAITVVLPVPPVITTPPVAQTVSEGGEARLVVTATGPALTYAWRKEGVALPGATAAQLELRNVQLSQAGAYSVTITNSAGSVESPAVRLTVNRAANPGRLVNLSVRTPLAVTDEVLSMGYVVGGAGTAGNKSVLIRAVGPGLSAFGVAGALRDPRLETYAGQARTGGNDNWGGGAALREAFAAVGAFPLANDSLDAALTATVSPGDNSVRISGAGGATGEVLAEVYDQTAGSAFATPSTPRLVNVSVLKPLAAGETLIAGFVVGGGAGKRLLVRAVGPGLTAGFGIQGALADPGLEVYRGPVATTTNDNWNAADAAVFTQVGAFNLPAGSRDAAVVLDVSPDAYSVQVRNRAAGGGVVLVEVYEVP
jgi:hypothetical protein